MDFEVSRKSRDYLGRLGAFMDEHVYPNEERYYLQPAGSRWDEPLFLEDLRHKARAAGLWNLFLPDSQRGAGLTNLEYAPLCELMGRVPWSPEVFNCAAPGYRQHGDARALRHRGTEARVARAAARRRRSARRSR